MSVYTPLSDVGTIEKEKFVGLIPVDQLSSHHIVPCKDLSEFFNTVDELAGEAERYQYGLLRSPYTFTREVNESGNLLVYSVHTPAEGEQNRRKLVKTARCLLIWEHAIYGEQHLFRNTSAGTRESQSSVTPLTDESLRRITSAGKLLTSSLKLAKLVDSEPLAIA